MDDIIRATRRFAKRQLTWFNREADINWYESGAVEEIADRVVETLEAADLDPLTTN